MVDSIIYFIFVTTKTNNMERILDVNGTSIIKNFPNGFDSWRETHCEISKEVGRRMASDTFGDGDTELERIQNEEGTGGIWTFIEKLTDEFEETYNSDSFAEEQNYFEVIDKFFEEKL